MDGRQRDWLVCCAVSAFALDLEYVVDVVTEDHVPDKQDRGPVVWGSPPLFVEEGPDR